MRVLILLSALFLISCGERESEENVVEEIPQASFSYSFDMNDKLNDLTIMNLKTIVREPWGEAYSRLNAENEFGAGVRFPINKLEHLLGERIAVKAKVRKVDINSNTSIVATCDNNGENIYWAAAKLDSTFVKEPNKWVDIIYDGFVLPINAPATSTVSFYFWNTDGIQVDVDDFTIETKNF